MIIIYYVCFVCSYFKYISVLSPSALFYAFFFKDCGQIFLIYTIIYFTYVIIVSVAVKICGKISDLNCTNYLGKLIY